MTPPHLDARRAAVLFDQMWGRGVPLSDGALRAAWADEDLAEGLLDPDSFPRARRKAVEDLHQLGLVIEERPRGLLLAPQDAATSPLLPVETAEWELRNRIRWLLDQLDPERGGLCDPRVIVKLYVPRDRLSLGYGARDEPLVGVPYSVIAGDRDRLLIRTDDGDRAIFLDSVRSVRLVKVGADDVRDGDEDPPLMEAPACRSPMRESVRGRPPTPRQLRDASSVIAALPAALGSDTSSVIATRPAAPGEPGEPHVTLDGLSVSSGLPVARVRELLPVASLLCGFDLCEDPDDDTKVIVYENRSAGPHPLNASEALAARLDATAVIALRGAEAEMGVELSSEQLELWLARLDSFLSCTSLDFAVPPTPFARNVVAATSDDDVISVAIDGGAEYHVLKPEGLAWSRHRWWVLGTLDGHDLGRTGLALDRISGVLVE